MTAASDPSGPTWSAPVRYAEVDAQGIVFNAHYLLYCDETMNAFCHRHGLDEFAAGVRLVTSTLTWTAPAAWGDVIEITATCARVGRTSAGLTFVVRASGRDCCTVHTTYVLVDDAGWPIPIPEHTRTILAAG